VYYSATTFFLLITETERKTMKDIQNDFDNIEFDFDPEDFEYKMQEEFGKKMKDLGNKIRKSVEVSVKHLSIYFPHNQRTLGGTSVYAIRGK
jgi:hypothetical protein